MGVLNVTPDSFSDGGRFLDSAKAIDHALRMTDEGADIIDIGGESSRPGSLPISADEELKRVIPVVEGVRKKSSVTISVDTTKSQVAKQAIGAGANMINDISAGRFDPEILEVASSAQIPICLMHMKGNPENMQDDPKYGDLMGEIRDFLADAVKRTEMAGVAPEKIIIDPGIGFGKSAQDNVTILKELSKLSALGRTILIGPSRKSFIGKLLGLTVENRLEATLATLSLAYREGASIFRVHNVAPARRYLDMVDLLSS